MDRTRRGAWVNPLAANLTNLTILETVRRHYLDEYRGILTQSLLPVHGRLPLPSGPGLGVDLDPAVFDRPNVEVEWVKP